MAYIRTNAGWIADRLVDRIELAPCGTEYWLLDANGDYCAVAARDTFDPDRGGYRPEGPGHD
jgi:hypothetical protein